MTATRDLAPTDKTLLAERDTEASISPLALVSGVGAGGFRDGFSGAIVAPLFTAQASALSRCGGSSWRPGRRRQRRAAHATPSR